MRVDLYKTFINKPIGIEPLDIPELQKNHLSAGVLRLDKIHPVVSGNKEFKLKYFLIAALAAGADSIITWGGAFSNHLVATAFAARENGIGSTGIVRGERPLKRSTTLLAAISYGMRLRFVSREEYGRKSQPETLGSIRKEFPRSWIIPEGGAGPEGIRGSEEILKIPGVREYTHILCAVGTGTMFTGIARGSLGNQVIMGFPVFKSPDNLLTQCAEKIGLQGNMNNIRMFHGYHFGGYAKKNKELIDFMNSFYRLSSIPLDFVYTAKLFYGAMDLVQQNYFPKQSRLLLIHSGGLQGNESIPKGILAY